MQHTKQVLDRGFAAQLRKTFTRCCIAAATLGVALPAHAYADTPVTPGTFSDWVARNYLVTAGNPDDPLYSTMKGTGYDGIAALFVSRTDGNFLCTGALLSGTFNVLTAAHCLADATGQNITQSVTTVFFTPNGPDSARELIPSSATYVNPMYTGSIIDAHDIGVVSLAAAPSLAVRQSGYQLYTGVNPLQVFEFVGSGASGTGSTGADMPGGFLLSDRRRAWNQIDFNWADPIFGGFFYDYFVGADPFSLVADFDNGLAANDATCMLFGTFCDLGLGKYEGILGQGDSGGPMFINGQIAGVASYGITFGRVVGDIDDALNSSYGEFAGWTSTQYNQEWLAPFATVVPEPGSIALVAAGLLGILFVSRKRRSTPS